MFSPEKPSQAASVCPQYRWRESHGASAELSRDYQCKYQTVLHAAHFHPARTIHSGHYALLFPTQLDEACLAHLLAAASITDQRLNSYSGGERTSPSPQPSLLFLISSPRHFFSIAHYHSRNFGLFLSRHLLPRPFPSPPPSCLPFLKVIAGGGHVA